MTINFSNTYIKLPDNFYSKEIPTTVENPELICFNHELSLNLNLNLNNLNKNDLALIFSGNKILNKSEPISLAYAGHQFGYFTILGDGRAILLGEILDKNQIRKDIQLKGSGKTAFSRNGDGRATLSSVLREYLISEAMFALKIPTTRSLAVVSTGEKILRPMPLNGGILTRIANSHIRIGTFEYFKYLNQENNIKILADYVINRHYPDCLENKNIYLSLFEKILEKQASLIAKWLSIGFIHGVMNTDNMSICGETIDYGPCAFLDEYNSQAVFSFIDQNGRYSYENQPAIAKWNLIKLAETLLFLFSDNQEESIELVKEKINLFNNLFENFWLEEFRKKLGLIQKQKDDKILISNLLNLMQEKSLDFTNTFYLLSNFNKQNIINTLSVDWFNSWQNRLNQEKTNLNQQINLMKLNNPVYIPRNHLVEKALNLAEQKDFSEFFKLLKLIQDPFSEKANTDLYKKIPESNERILNTFCGT